MKSTKTNIKNPGFLSVIVSNAPGAGAEIANSIKTLLQNVIAESMKRLLLTFGLLALLAFGVAGQKKEEFIFNEVFVSVNNAAAEKANITKSFGAGICMNRAFWTEKQFNLIAGLGFNHNRQFMAHMHQSHFAYALDVNLQINTLTVPVGVRLNLGKKLKILVEAGVFADLILSGHRSGVMHSYYPDENNQIVYTQKAFDKRFVFSSTYGLFSGIGVRIPLAKYELVLKPTYFFGIPSLYSHGESIYGRYLSFQIGLNFGSFNR